MSLRNIVLAGWMTAVGAGCVSSPNYSSPIPVRYQPGVRKYGNSGYKVSYATDDFHAEFKIGQRMFYVESNGVYVLHNGKKAHICEVAKGEEILVQQRCDATDNFLIQVANRWGKTRSTKFPAREGSISQRVVKK